MLPAKTLLWGITDQNTVARDAVSPDLRPQEENARRHRDLGFNALSWHMYVGYCQFPTRVGTIPPLIDDANPEHVRIARRNAGPHYRHEAEKAWRELVHRHDCMAEGSRIAREHGLAYAPCLRMNNEWHASWVLHYHPNMKYWETFWCPKFFMEHPEYWSRFKHGGKAGGGMDYSHPEVRAYRLAIFREVMAYGPRLDALFLDLHRHAPMVSYPDRAVAAFKRRHGIDVRKLEPLDADVMDPRWHALRADYFTTFMRAFRKAQARLARRAPIVVRCGPTFEKALHEGADLRAWFREGLVDALMLEEHGPGSRPGATPLGPVAREARRAGVRVMGAFASPAFVRKARWTQLARIMDGWMEQGASGVAFYESSRVVALPKLRKHLAAWARAAN
jgi:hypothetical protein